jgi:hypothetical protein
LAEAVRKLSGEEAERVRRFLIGFGSCSITEPVGDLVGLGLMRAQP